LRRARRFVEAGLWRRNRLQEQKFFAELFCKKATAYFLYFVYPLAMPASPPVIWIDSRGYAGNRVLRYLAAAGIARLVPGAQVQNANLPEWGITQTGPMPSGRVVHSGDDRFWLDAEGLADCLRRGVMDALVIEGHPYHIAHYPPRAVCRQLLGPMQGGEDAVGFGADELVCSVRAGEILHAVHGNYLPLPPGYYAKLVAMTGLKLVFLGQLGDDPYSAGLRAAFPGARFIPSRGPAHDFETLRRSRNIALSISTFAWAAAWLGEPDRVFLPVGGIFNPLMQGNQGFLAADEPDFHFMLLPMLSAVDLFAEPVKFRAQQMQIGAECRPITPAEARGMAELGMKLMAHGPYVGGFDPEFYVAQPGLEGIANPLEHYLRTGCMEHRMQVRVDAAFYLREYPEAAAEIASGRYLSALHHYVASGWKRGFAPEARK